jgi:hypothetical protein
MIKARRTLLILFRDELSSTTQRQVVVDMFGRFV